LRLQREGKGFRTALFRCYRVDGKEMELTIGTTRASFNVTHLFQLFAEKIPQLEPGLGIELFTLEAPKVDEDVSTHIRCPRLLRPDRDREGVPETAPA
jgi:protein ImuB